jgi:hypothetical protein
MAAWNQGQGLNQLLGLQFVLYFALIEYDYDDPLDRGLDTCPLPLLGDIRAGERT